MIFHQDFESNWRDWRVRRCDEAEESRKQVLNAAERIERNEASKLTHSYPLCPWIARLPSELSNWYEFCSRILLDVDPQAHLEGTLDFFWARM